MTSSDYTSFDSPPTVPLTVPPPAAQAPRSAPPRSYADLPEAPPAYHQQQTAKPARSAKLTKRKRRPLHRQEAFALAVGLTVLVLVVAKALADSQDVDSNVVDYLLVAVLAAIVGVVVVGVGGALIDPMRTRWTRLLAEDPAEQSGSAGAAGVYPTDPRLL